MEADYCVIGFPVSKIISNFPLWFDQPKSDAVSDRQKALYVLPCLFCIILKQSPLPPPGEINEN